MFSSINDVAVALDLSPNGAELTNELKRGRLRVIQDALSSKQRERRNNNAVVAVARRTFPFVHLPAATGSPIYIKAAAAGCRDAFGENGGAPLLASSRRFQVT